MNELTEKGREIVRDSPPLLQDRFDNELKKLADWELTLILSSLQRVASMMSAEGLAASPVLATNGMNMIGYNVRSSGM